MLVMPNEPDPPRDVSAQGKNVLRRLAAQHRALLDGVSLLETLLARGESAMIDSNLVHKLLDKLLEAPDDFHHFIERQLFYRLWFRVGCFLPRYLDLDLMHIERRAARDAVVGLRETKAARLWQGAEVQSALSSLCRLVRVQVETEETQFYPLLRNELTSADWAGIEEEMNAFEACSHSLRARQKH